MKTVELTIAGSGDAFGSGGRLNTCFYVKTPSVKFLIDCGATVLPALKANKIKPSDIDVILITHFHGDHFGGLPFFLLESSIYLRKKPLTIVSPPGCREKISQLLSLLYPGTKVLEKLTIHFEEYKPYRTLATDHLSLTAYPMVHTEAADKIISYSGDTEWTQNLVELSAHADLFICECNFFNMRVKGHLNYQILKEKVGNLTCKQILLTHFDTEMLDNLHQVSLHCARDGMKVEL